jgi:hypothetical protein
MLQKLTIDAGNKDTSRSSEYIPAPSTTFFSQTIDQQSHSDNLRKELLENIYVGVAPDSINKEAEKSFLIRDTSPPFEPRPRPSSEFDCFFVAVVIFLLLLSFIKTKFLKKPGTFYKVLINETYIKNNYDKETFYSYFSVFPFILCSWIVFSLILYTFLCQSGDHSGNTILFWSFVCMIILFIVRFILFHFVGLLFKMKEVISEVSYLTKMINFVIAVFSLPIIVVDYYYSFPFSLLFVLIIFTGFSLYRIVLGWGFLKQNFYVYEYFLYFCTTEILPLLILLKFMSNKL